MAYSANNTKLFYDKNGTMTPINDVMEIPELGVMPEKIDVTTLESPVKKYIFGIKDMGELAFKFLYDPDGDDSVTPDIKSNWVTLEDLEGSDESSRFRIEYPDGSAHNFSAFVNLKMDAATINGALTFTCTMVMDSDISMCECEDKENCECND